MIEQKSTSYFYCRRNTQCAVRRLSSDLPSRFWSSVVQTVHVRCLYVCFREMDEETGLVSDKKVRFASDLLRHIAQCAIERSTLAKMPRCKLTHFLHVPPRNSRQFLSRDDRLARGPCVYPSARLSNCVHGALEPLCLCIIFFILYTLSWTIIIVYCILRLVSGLWPFVP